MYNNKKVNKEFILDTVINDGYKLRFVPKNFKEDKSIVLTAVQNYDLVLEYTSE
jgi:hypothetical protein